MPMDLPPASREARWPEIAVVFLAAAAMAWWGGQPYYHPDLIADEALAVLQNHGDPRYFHYPGFVIYLHAAGYAVLGWLRLLFSGGEETLSGALVAMKQDGSLMAFAHLLTAFFSGLGAAAAWRAAALLGARRSIRLLAGCLLAFALLWVRNGHYVTVDIPLAALCLWTVVVAMRVGQRTDAPQIRHAVILGVLTGLVVATKYNGVVVALPVALVLLGNPRGAWRQRIALLLWAGLSSVVVFVIFNPFLFLDWSLAREHLHSRTAEVAVGRLGYFMDNGWWFHLRYSLGDGYGYGLLALALLGGWWTLQPGQRKSGGWLLSVFVLAFWFAMGRSHVAFQRHILPVLPFLAVLSARGLERLADGLVRGVPRVPWLAALLVLWLPLAGHAAWQSVRHDWVMSRGDTRSDLEEVLRQAELDTASLHAYSGRYGRRAVRSSHRRWGKLDFSSHGFPAGDPIHAGPIRDHELVVLDSFSHERLMCLLPPGAPPPPLDQAVELIQFSPFRDFVWSGPPSPDSIYSPALPDLRLRKKAGPWIEVYCRDPAITRALTSACARCDTPYQLRPWSEGHYASLLQGLPNEGLRR